MLSAINTVPSSPRTKFNLQSRRDNMRMIMAVLCYQLARRGVDVGNEVSDAVAETVLREYASMIVDAAVRMGPEEREPRPAFTPRDRRNNMEQVVRAVVYQLARRGSRIDAQTEKRVVKALLPEHDDLLLPQFAGASYGN